MKYVLIGVGIWFMLSWGIQLIKAWILQIRFWWKKRHYKGNDAWVYHI